LKKFKGILNLNLRKTYGLELNKSNGVAEMSL